MEILPRNSYDTVQRVKLMFTMAFEVCVLIFLATIGYYIRIGDRFPRRLTPFQPDDVTISYRRGQGLRAMEGFDFKAELSEVVVVVLSFCLPPAVMLVGELIQCRKCNTDQSLSISGACLVCHFFSPTRRIFRFTATFLMGILITIIFNDVTKFMIGRHRPIFLEVCSFNQSACYNYSWYDKYSIVMCDPIEACANRDQAQLAWASKSFPSFHASITAFSSVFTAIYIQRTLGHNLKCRILGPFFGLSFVMMSLLCCLQRYARFYSHWTDVVVGFGWGTIMAVYLAVFNLNNFQERKSFRNLGGDDDDDGNVGGGYDHHHHRHHQLSRFKSTEWNENLDKIPWYWAPWHWSNNDFQNSRLTLDRYDNKTSTLATNYNNNHNTYQQSQQQQPQQQQQQQQQQLQQSQQPQQQQQQIKFNNPLVVNNDSNNVVMQRQKSRDNVTSLEDYY